MGTNTGNFSKKSPFAVSGTGVIDGSGSGVFRTAQTVGSGDGDRVE
jgi:hypothetical protein